MKDNSWIEIAISFHLRNPGDKLSYINEIM